MSKARDLADLAKNANDRLDDVATSDGALSNRSLIINGGMTVAQRGTSFTGFGAIDAYTTVDRWMFDKNSTMSGRMTIEQVDDSPNGISGKSVKLSCTTADTTLDGSQRVQIQQRFEGQNLQSIGKGTPDAKPITVSFYVKANASFTYGLELYDGDNGRQITKLFNTTTEWSRVEITFPADTVGAFDNDNSLSLYLIFAIHAGATYTGGTLNSDAWADAVSENRAGGIDSFYSSTDNELFITGIQLEVGDTATPFEHRSYGQELALCQRYYEGGDKNHGKTQCYAGSVGHLAYRLFALSGTKFSTTMRATPTISVWSNQTNTAGQVSGYSSGINRTVNQGPFANEKGIVGYIQTTTNTTSNEPQVFFWAADAEL